jgi:hypothetical protein
MKQCGPEMEPLVVMLMELATALLILLPFNCIVVALSLTELNHHNKGVVAMEIEVVNQTCKIQSRRLKFWTQSL